VSSSLQSLGLLLIRVVVGVVFVAHGWQKLAVDGLAATQAGFAGMGIPLASVAAPVAAVTEIAAGAALIVGFATRVAAVLLAVTAVVAIVAVHLPNGFFSTTGGIEYVLVLAATAIALALTGPGRLALDALVVRGRRARRDASVTEPVPA